MKKIFKLIVVAASFVVIAAQASAQNENSLDKSPELLSAKGYWVIQTNKNKPTEQTVLFYNTENRLISQQQFKGRKLNPESRKTKIKLKKALDTALRSTGYSMGEGDQPIYFAGFN